MISKKVLISFILLSVCLTGIICPPVKPETKKTEGKEIKDEAEKEGEDDPILNLEYHRYLKEVVNLLESDPEFKNLIEKADPEDIKSGKISEKLQFVKHNIRTKLDELKRKEVDRLRELIARRAKLNNIQPHDIHTLLPKHIDHNNVETFEEKDLETLIKSASNDLENLDKLRREQFKQHEIEKEFDRRKHLEGLDENTRKKEQEEHERNVEKQKHHAKVNHPGSKDQLEEVWEDQDHLDGKFDPKTFFNLHDIDGDGFLNTMEIEALFESELNKVFNASDPEYDPAEREEEMNRMREHVFQEMDTDKNQMISYEEFLHETKDADFEDNQDWEDVEDDKQYNQEEFDAYSKAHMPLTTPIPAMNHDQVKIESNDPHHPVNNDVTPAVTLDHKQANQN